MLGQLKVAVVGAASIAAGGIAGSLTSAGTPTELWFLDVGQGDCAVFRHEGVTVLIDAGPALVERDTASGRIVGDLRRMGVTTIDLVLLSHPDSDHVGGLRGIAQQIPVRKVGVMDHYASNADMAFWLGQAKVDRNQLVWLQAGSRIEVGSFKLHVDAARMVHGDPDNFGSMFVQIENGTAAADFTGDADTISEAVVLGHRNWRAQVLKAGHHGSRTSSSLAWIQAVQPSTIVISCGRNNIYGHPAKEMLDRASGSGALVARTDQEGDLKFVVEKGRFVRAR